MSAELFELPPVPQKPARPKLRARITVKASKLFSSVNAAWSATDIEDRFFFPGLALIGFGVYRLSPDYAPIVVGAVLILAVRPLRRWL